MDRIGERRCGHREEECDNQSNDDKTLHTTTSQLSYWPNNYYRRVGYAFEEGILDMHQRPEVVPSCPAIRMDTRHEFGF
jgi:hypothetical protein